MLGFDVYLLKKLPEPKCQANVLAQGNKYDANNAETAPPPPALSKTKRLVVN